MEPATVAQTSKPSDGMMAMCETCQLSPTKFGMCVGMQDGGASSMVGGHDVVMEVFLFVQRGLEFDTLAFTQTNKNFLFGGDHRCLADWSTPAGVDRRRQGAQPMLPGFRVYAYLDRATAPEGSEVQGGTDRVSVMGEDWTTILKGPKGEHLLCLEDGLTEDTLHTNYQFDYVEDFLADGVLHGLGDYLRHTGRDGPVFTMEEILLEEDEATVENLEQNARLMRENAGLTPAVERPLPTSMWKSLIYGINRSKNELDRHLLLIPPRSTNAQPAGSWPLLFKCRRQHCGPPTGSMSAFSLTLSGSRSWTRPPRCSQ